MNIEAAGALIRSAEEPLPICYSEEHKLDSNYEGKCDLALCNSEDHKAIGLQQDCRLPICGSEQHQAVGLETECAPPVCNSPDHEIVGLDKDCLPICNSEEHKAVGLDKDCRKAINEKTFVLGSSIANAWMYDGDVWNPVRQIPTARESMACGLVQTETGVSSHNMRREFQMKFQILSKKFL